MRTSLIDPDFLQLSWGEGTGRQHLETESAELAAALMTLPSAIELEEVDARLSKVLPDEQQRTQLIDYLRRHDLLRSEPQPLPATEVRWEKLGWRDALVLHKATRNQLWEHKYPPNPQVMTWVNYDTPILPESERPTVDDSIDERAVRLPAPSGDRLEAV